MAESKVNMSLDDIIKLKKKEAKVARGGAMRGAGVTRGRALRGARGGRGNVGMNYGIASRGLARHGALQRRSAPTLARAGNRIALNSIQGNNNAAAPRNRMLNRLVKRAVKRALATTSRPRGNALNRGGAVLTHRALRKPLGGGILRRVGARGAFAGAGLNRVQAQSRVIQRKVAPKRVFVQRVPMAVRRFQRISSPDVINRPVRQQTFPARARPQTQTVLVRRVVRQAPPQRTIVQRTIARQPQRQQIVERVIPRVRAQQIIRRPVQEVIHVERVIQRPQQQIQYVQQRSQRGATRGRARRINNRVQVERIPRFEYNNSPRVILRRGRGFQNY